MPLPSIAEDLRELPAAAHIVVTSLQRGDVVSIVSRVEIII
jgi:hypothetical protein